MGKRQERWKKQVREALRTAVLTPWNAFKSLCFTIGLGVILLATLTGVGIALFLGGLPKLELLDFPHFKLMAARNVGRKLENPRAPYTWVDLKDVNRDLIYAIVSSEDATFFEHSGLNPEAIAMAIAQNWKKKKIESGASTITQQVVKNTFLTQERTLTRKLKEWIITGRLERRFTKNQILEVYLNTAEFGPDLYGIDQAAKRYFHKPPAKINAAEGALLAVLLPSPRKGYHAILVNKNLSPKKRRRIRRILLDMVSQELIGEKQYRAYLKYPFMTKLSSAGEEEEE